MSHTLFDIDFVGLIKLFVFIYRLSDKTVKEYAVYRSPLLFWGLVDLIYDMFRVQMHALI